MKKMYDLSQPHYNDMPCAPNIGTYEANLVKTHSENGLQVTQFNFFSHTGTHLDAPKHMIPDGKTIEQIPLEWCRSTCYVVDAQVGPFGEITIANIEAADIHPEPGDFIFFYTGFGDKFDDPDYVDAPSFSVELAQWLVDHKIRIVGIDANTVDITYSLRKPGFNFPVHHVLLGNETLIIEHLSLKEVVGKKLEVTCFPINMVHSDGAPVRVVGTEL